MWKSEKFAQAADAAWSVEHMTSLVEAHFDFEADESSDPVVVSSGDVLEIVGLANNHANSMFMGKALRALVGEPRRTSHNGRVGRYYALPPRKEPWL